MVQKLGLVSPWILRGNWDFTFSGAFTWIPRGPETHYEAYDMGIRRNFVHRNWRTASYFDEERMPKIAATHIPGAFIRSFFFDTHECRRYGA